MAALVDCLVAALESIAVELTSARHDSTPQRRAVISARRELQERASLKWADLDAIPDALRARRADDTTARPAAEMAFLALSTSDERWAATADRRPLNAETRVALRDLQARTTTAGTGTDVRARPTTPP